MSPLTSRMTVGKPAQASDAQIPFCPPPRAVLTVPGIVHGLQETTQGLCSQFLAQGGQYLRGIVIIWNVLKNDPAKIVI